MTGSFALAVDGAWIDIPGGWATIIVAFLTVVIGPLATVIVTTRLSGKVKEMKADVAATKDQVANDHVDEHGRPINMRVEQDDRHDEIMSTLSTVVDTQKAQGRTIDGMRRDIGRLADSDLAQNLQAQKDRDRIDAIEKTYPRNELGQFTTKEKS